MAKSAKSNANGYVLPPEKMKQREKAFQLYRDLGPTRSIHQLVALLAQDYPEIAASRPSLDRWSRLHDWQKRVKAHDLAVRRGQVQAAASPVMAATPAAPASSGEFDQIDALLKAANQALTRAMSAAPVVTKPGDVKALVDAAANALKLIETIKNQSSGKVSREEIAQEMARILAEVEKARRLDVEVMVEAELKKLGLKRAADGGVAPVAPAAVEAIEVEPGDESEEVAMTTDAADSGNTADGAGKRTAATAAALRRVPLVRMS